MRTKSTKSTNKKLAAAALLAVAALTLTACGGDDDKKSVADVSVESDSGKAATVLDKPYKKPNLVLTDTHGKKYDLREETKGKPTLVYFGYTHCPDVCPLTMNNIAVAKKALPKADQDKLKVVFVTTDPDRDTPAELGKWLKGVDADFVGLTGDFATIQAGARQLAISIEPSKKDKNGKIVSMHGTQVLAFSPKNDAGYVLYGEDATAGDYTKDLPKLLKGQTP
ncbi:SCO family protein [Streptomyces sp. Je 1-369]|uniref:SCO family protein n=1 Tax=Streptomyces sp. Je 1-369 TaxID=2966192 RepID=UPI00228551D1|nr:SCO family protein [Streptomyces sp. Je 1-369]WAL96560.1 SCO family protein [Streptomyces sp. Je 1-369]